MGFFDKFGGALLGGAFDLLGAGGSAYGQHRANEQNLALSREQMAFQERMRDTQYQAAVKDMKAAGINPMVAYSQGGAAAPSGAAIAMQNPYQNGFSGRGVQSGLAAQKFETEVDLARSVTEKNIADADLAREMRTSQIYNQVNTQANTNLAEANRQNVLKSNEILSENLVTAKGQAARAKVEGEIDNTTYGKLMRYLDRLPIPFVNSAKGMLPK